jgi:hypothetical protein
MPARQNAYVAKLAVGARSDVSRTRFLRQAHRLMEARRSFSVPAADGVDERRAERAQRLRAERGVAAASGLGAGLAQRGQTGLHGAGRDRRVPRLEQAPGGGGATGPAAFEGSRALRRPPDRVGRVEAELAAKERLARGRLRLGLGPVAALDEAAHEDLLIALLERVQRDSTAREIGGLVHAAGGEPGQRAIVQGRLPDAVQMPPLEQEPGGEDRGVELHSLEELPAPPGRLGGLRRRAANQPGHVY